MKYKIAFPELGITALATEGDTVLERAARAGVALRAPCGGRGTCGKCAVRIVEGELQPSPECREIFSETQLAEGWRLACRARVAGDVSLEIPPESILRRGVVALDATGNAPAENAVSSAPFAERRTIRLDEPSLESPVSDLENLKKTLELPKAEIHLEELRKLPGILRENAFETTVDIADGNIVALSNPNKHHAYVAAIDLGTTTIAASLLDAATGRRVATGGVLNPQVEFGDDVLSRVCAQSESDEKRKRLAELATAACDRLIRGFRDSADIPREDVIAVTIAGNTVMQSLILGVPTKYLGEIPFPPPFSEPLLIDACEIGLGSVAKHAETAVFPVIGGYVGGDISAGLLAAEFAKPAETALFIDIGTNGEIVLRHDGRLLATAAAAGPAFEGARIERGIRAVTGAIAAAAVENGDLKLDVIGDQPPVGVCGSGLIDLVAVALDNGILDETGRFLAPDEAENAPEPMRKRLVLSDDGAVDFIVAENGGDTIFLRQKDIRQLQLASGAIRAAINILMGKAGIDADDLNDILVAGGFGNFINPENARRIGLLPNPANGKTSFLGNTSLLGAEIAATDSNAWSKAAENARAVEIVDISLDPEFQIEFANAMIFPTKTA